MMSVFEYLDGVFSKDRKTFDLQNRDFMFPISDEQHKRNLEWEICFAMRYFNKSLTMDEGMYLLEKLRSLRDWSRE